ncbi:MAG: hypothetical protein FDX18_05610 [Chlorobium sp.]|nr:MAG: hypothetical protein FDX18_05610 [Chlorobium sp.]
MKTQIKAAIISGCIAGGIAIAVALITVFGHSKSDNKSEKPATPTVQVTEYHGQIVTGDSNKSAGRDFYNAPVYNHSVKQGAEKP